MVLSKEQDHVDTSFEENHCNQGYHQQGALHNAEQSVYMPTLVPKENLLFFGSS